jgi:hypothetical protein
VRAERLPRVVVPHATPAEQVVQTSGKIVGALADLAADGEPPKGEDCEVRGRDHVHLVPRSPYLRERGILPRGRARVFDARVDGENCRAGHAVLKTGPRGTTK